MAVEEEEGFSELVYRVSRRTPTAFALSLTQKFTESQTDDSDAIDPDL
jgi:hypothetical protein